MLPHRGGAIKKKRVDREAVFDIIGEEFYVLLDLLFPHFVILSHLYPSAYVSVLAKIEN